MLAAYHKFLALSFKFPDLAAKFLVFCLIYRLKVIDGKDKKEIHTRDLWIIKDGGSVVMISVAYKIFHNFGSTTLRFINWNILLLLQLSFVLFLLFSQARKQIFIIIWSR